MPPKTRTDAMIVSETNVLAQQFYAILGYTVPEEFRFDRATHPQEVQMADGVSRARGADRHRCPQRC